MIVVTFACGHSQEFNGSEIEPRCGCGEAHIEQVVAPPPRFSGHVTGPHAETNVNLPAISVAFEKKDVPNA